MIITKKHTIDSYKVRKDIKILQLSDLHYNDFMDPNKLKKIIFEVFSIRPDYIIFCGDIFFSESKNYKNLVDFFFVLKTIAPVYITLGNHDLMALKGNKKGVKDLEWIENHHEEVMSALKNIRNVNILENRSVIIEEYNVLLTGINTDFAHYEATHEDPIDFIDYVNDLFPTAAPKDMFHEISCHSPKVILDKKYFSQIQVVQNADLIHSGHMHNGLVPPIINSIIKSNRGFLDPYLNVLPDLSRGEVNINKTKGIIGGPLTTLAESQGFKAKAANTVLPSRMDVVLVKKMY